MASGQPANVQAYLNKHKITQLFEELTALLVKELPIAPVDFLIQKLQARKKKASATSATSSRIPTSPATKKKQPPGVTGTGVSVTSRPPATGSTTTTTRKTTAQEARKPTPTDGPPAKPSTGRTVGGKMTSPSKLKPPSDSKRPGTGPTRLAGGGGTLGSTGKRLAPATSRSATATSGKGSTSSIPPPGRGRRVPGASTTTAASKGLVKKKPETGKAPPTKTAQKPASAPASAAKVPPPVAAVTAAAPSPGVVVGGDADDEETTEVSIRQGGYDSSGDEDREEDGGGQETKEDLDFNVLLERMRRSRQPKGRFLKQHLTTLLETDATTLSNVAEEEDESEGESGLEMVEGASDLEEEGVLLSEEQRHMARKLPLAPLVSVQVTVCARCTRVISREDEASSFTQSSHLPADEFESVSQVGSHVSFPQWDSGLASGPELTIHQKWMLSGKQPSSTLTQPSSGGSTVTPDSRQLISLTAEEGVEKTQPGAELPDALIEFSSEDTWKGVAPVSRPLDPPTEEESDFLLPMPVSYQQNAEDEQDETKQIDLSADAWKGVASTPRPLIPPSDEESELMLPAPVDYHKEDEQEEDAKDGEAQTAEDDLSDTLVESSSADTWKGITPASHIPVPSGSEDSELILPTPVGYQKGEEDEDDDGKEEVQIGEEDLSTTLVEDSSTDTWKGITPASHVPVPPSEEESDLLLPTPVTYQREVEDVQIGDGGGFSPED